MKVYKQIKTLFITPLASLNREEKIVFMFLFGIKIGTLGFYLGETIINLK